MSRDEPMRDDGGAAVTMVILAIAAVLAIAVLDGPQSDWPSSEAEGRALYQQELDEAKRVSCADRGMEYRRVSWSTGGSGGTHAQRQSTTHYRSICVAKDGGMYEFRWTKPEPVWASFGIVVWPPKRRSGRSARTCALAARPAHQPAK